MRMGHAGLLGALIHRIRHVLELYVVLVEVLDDADIVVLDVAILLHFPRHRVVSGHLLPVEASRVGLDHVLNELAIQILCIRHVCIVLFCNVDTVVKRLKSDPSGCQLLLMAVLGVLMRRWRLVVVVRLIQIPESLAHITLHILSNIRIALCSRWLIGQDPWQLTTILSCSPGDSVRVLPR